MERKKKESIGRLNQQIVIQRATVTENAYSDKVQTWADLLTVWAGVEYPMTKAGEEYEDVVNVATRSITFEIRPTDITVKDRISFDSKYFDINDIEKDFLNARWKINATSSV